MRVFFVLVFVQEHYLSTNSRLVRKYKENGRSAVHLLGAVGGEFNFGHHTWCVCLNGYFGLLFFLGGNIVVVVFRTEKGDCLLF